jgi:hypothetical protein
MSLAMISMAQSQQLTLCNLLALIHILVTLNCAAHLRLTPAIMFPQQLDGAADQNNTNSPPDEPPRMSSKPNSATTYIVLDVVGLAAVILLFIFYFKRLGSLRK